MIKFACKVVREALSETVEEGGKEEEEEEDGECI